MLTVARQPTSVGKEAMPDGGDGDGVVRAALAAFDQGGAVFDADLRLVAWNDPFFGSLSYPGHLMAKGAPLAQFLAHEAVAGAITTDDGAWSAADEIDRLRRGETRVAVVAAADGPRFVRSSRLPDGGVIRVVSASVEAHTASTGGAGAPGDVMLDRGLEMIEALDAMGDAIAYFDPDNRLALFNQKYAQLYGAIADRLVPGTPYADLVRAAVACGLEAPHDRPPENYLDWRLGQSRQAAAQFDVGLSTGEWLAVSERQTTSGGRVSVHSEITKLKERENALTALSRQLSDQNVLFDAALNNMIQGLCMFDSSQRLIVVNRRYLELYGFSPQVVKPGITLREIMEYSVTLGNYTEAEAERALAERPSHAARREQAVILQKLRDGRVIAVMHSPLPNGGSVATYEDVTKREEIEGTLREYASRLEKSNRELQDFAFVASHDLQEPLRKIESFGNRLVEKYRDQIGEDGQLYLDRMQNAAGRMRRLIGDLLSYSRVTTKAQPFQALELATIMDEVINDLQIAIEEAGGRIDVGPLPIVDADATQIRQLFQNLLSNSLKFRKKDTPIVIKVEGRILKMDVGNEHDVECCEIKICDNGIGFDNKYADKIFAIFQRLHGKSEYEGTGIGLATCRKIVDRHSGTIKAEGVVGEGAQFTIVMPTRQNETEQSSC
jgi:signal transduction histidine kinase